MKQKSSSDGWYFGTPDGDFVKLESTPIEEITDKPAMRDVRIIYEDGRVEYTQITEEHAAELLANVL